MKAKYTTFLAGAALMLGATSCVDLDLAPLDQKSDATVWVEPSDAEQAVSILYNYVPNAMWQNDEDIYTDNAVHGIKWAVGNRAHGLWQTTDFSWSSEYTYIRRANLLLENIDKIPNYPQDAKNQVLGQAYCFRAWIYFDLIKQFGDVPLETQTLDLADQENIVRTPWKEVYNQVMSDFDKAISLLNSSASNGRLTKGAALALKARAALYFANPACAHYVEDGYRTAQSAAKQVMDMGIYGLYDGNYSGTAKDYTGNYPSMFWDLNIVSSNEAILTCNEMKGMNGSYFIGFEAFPTIGWGGTNPTQGFVDCFEDCEGAPIEKSKIYDPLNPSANRDPRLNTNVLFPGQTLYNIELHTEPLNSSGVRALFGQAKACGDATLTGYQARKWLNPVVFPDVDGWDHNAGSAPIRYAEVLLTYAEATNELNGLAQDAFDAVNKVRARVGMPALQNTDPSLPTYCATQDDLRQRIRNEWRVEFCFEGDHRQWDVRRWNIAKEVLNAPRLSYKYTLRQDPANALPGNDGWVCDLYVGESDVITNQILVYADHNYIFPIPQDQIDLNPKLTQNPGYSY